MWPEVELIIGALTSNDHDVMIITSQRGLYCNSINLQHEFGVQTKRNCLHDD